MRLRNARTYGSSCRERCGRGGGATKEQENGEGDGKEGSAEESTEKDETEKGKGGGGVGVERALKALKHFAQQMPYSAWQSDLWLCSIYTLSVTSGPAEVRNACMQHSCNAAG